MQDGMVTLENSLKAAYRVPWPKNPPIKNENIHVGDQEGDSVAKALVAGVWGQVLGCPESISMLSGCDSQPVALDSEGGDGGSLDKFTRGSALSESSGFD